jgi:hypothetical protein
MSRKKQLLAGAAPLTPNRPAASTTGAMLQWTCRLRDIVERRDFWIDDRNRGREPQWETIREAEFACDDGCFPDGFRWDTLASCYSQNYFNVVLVPHGSAGSRPIDPNCASYRAIRSLAGEEITDLTRNNINVLWLSQNIFISQIFFNLDGYCVDEYELKFHYRRGSMEIFVYALSSFGDGEPDIHSPVPIAFLRHVTALLPIGHISEVLLARDYPQRCPLDMAFNIASCIVPNDDQYSPETERRWTTFRIGWPQGAVITKDEIKDIVFHPFHPTIRPAFKEGHIRFEESVSLTSLMDMLQEPQSVRAINLPCALVKAEGENNSLFYRSLTLNSAGLSIEYEGGLMAPECLHRITTAYFISDIRMTFDHHFWGGDPERLGSRLRLHVKPFLLAHSSVESLLIRFDNKWYYNELSHILKTMPSVFAGCASRKLCFVNIALVYTYEARDVFFSRDLDNAQWSLDDTLFPRLVLNYWSNHLPKPLKERVMPSAIKAVNEGNIYRKTTNLVPSGMGTANAGLIFQIVKTASTGLSRLDGSSSSCRTPKGSAPNMTQSAVSAV